MEEARLTPDQPSSSEAAFPPHAPTALRSGEHGEMGRRNSMEDAIARVEDVDVSGRGDDGGPLAFYVICDGHGGSAAAEYVSKYLVKNITADERFRKDPSVAMVRALTADYGIRDVCGGSAKQSRPERFSRQFLPVLARFS